MTSSGRVLDWLLPVLEGYIDTRLARHAAIRHPAEGDVDLALLDAFMAATVMGRVGAGWASGAANVRRRGDVGSRRRFLVSGPRGKVGVYSPRSQTKRFTPGG